MRLITINKSISRRFQDDPIATFDFILDVLKLDRLSLAYVNNFIDRKLSMPSWVITSENFKGISLDLNSIHKSIREDCGVYLTGPELISEYRRELCQEYTKRTRPGSYLDAYRTGLISVLDEIEESLKPGDKMVEDIKQNMGIFHAVFLLASTLDRQDQSE